MMRIATDAGDPHPDDNNGLPVRAFAHLNDAALKARFDADHEFLFLPDFLPTDTLAALQAHIPALLDAVHRNYIPGHKKGGSVSRYELDRRAPGIAALYRDPLLVAWLEALAGERLLPCPASDPHAYALYFYTEAGDHIGWHYDSSYYRGKRYTLLLGVVNDATSTLEYQLFRDEAARETMSGAAALTPGAMCFFNGDAVYHRITPLGANQRRIALTFEYVTDTGMNPFQRFISDMKDAIAYFGFRQVFAPRGRGGNGAGNRAGGRSDPGAGYR